MKCLIIFLLLITSNLYSQDFWGVDTDSHKNSFYDWKVEYFSEDFSTATKENFSGFTYVNVFNNGESYMFVKYAPSDFMITEVFEYLNSKLGQFDQRDSTWGGVYFNISYRWRTAKKAVLLSIQRDYLKVDIVRLDNEN